jgi:hypothetical protein
MAGTMGDFWNGVVDISGCNGARAVLIAPRTSVAIDDGIIPPLFQHQDMGQVSQLLWRVNS